MAVESRAEDQADCGYSTGAGDISVSEKQEADDGADSRANHQSVSHPAASFYRFALLVILRTASFARAPNDSLDVLISH
jgi:hypothetical protein